MIIKRKYEVIGELVKKDLDAKKILMDALLTHFSQNEAERILMSNNESCIYNADTSSCIPNIDEVKAKFAELDKKRPYDNELTFRDVTQVFSFPSRQGKATELWMISKKVEVPARIVQVVAIEYDEGELKTIKPWGEDSLVL